MAKFDKIASIYDSFFIQFYYVWVHRKSIKFIREFLKNNWRILDVACGTGNFLAKLKKVNKNIDFFGIDESEAMIRIAQEKNGDVKFSVSKAEALSFPGNYFNLITTTDAFYYFKDKERAISEFHRVLKPGGYLFIFTPSVDNLLSRNLLKLSKLSPLEWKSEHLFFKEIKLLTEKYGFKIIKKGSKFYNWLILFQK